jgi:hypothetical protein
MAFDTITNQFMEEGDDTLDTGESTGLPKPDKTLDEPDADDDGAEVEDEDDDLDDDDDDEEEAE